MKCEEIRRFLNGRGEGELDYEVRGISSPEDAGEGDVVVIFREGFKGDGRRVGCVVSKDRVEGLIPHAYIFVENPEAAFFKLLQLFEWAPPIGKGIMDGAIVEDDVSFGKDVTVFPFVYIESGAKIGSRVVLYPFTFVGEGAHIGDDTLILPEVYIGRGVRIGKRVIIHPGARIGTDGFGYRKDREGYKKIPQVGTVVIEDDCEIGANTTIDRATVGETRIGRGTKIDNLVQIAHNVKIGENTVIAAQTGIAGSTKVGKWVVMAGQVGIADHITIGDNVIVTAKSGVSRNVPDNLVVSGIYARERGHYLKSLSLFFKLPEIFERLVKLERMVKKWEEQLREK